MQEKDRIREREPDRLRRSEIEDHVELRGLFHGKIRGLCAFEDPVHEVRGAPIHRREVLPIGHQTTSYGPPFLLKHTRQPLLYREVDDLVSLMHRHRILQDEERVGALFGDRGKSSSKVLRSLHLVGSAPGPRLRLYATPGRPVRSKKHNV